MFLVEGYGGNCIKVFTPTGVPVATWGDSGAATGRLNAPNGVAVDCSGRVYVADASNHRIQQFAADGSFILQWGGRGSGDGQFDYPIDAAVDSTGSVYVTDLYNHRIQKFTSSGTLITKWGSFGSTTGQLHNPYGIAVNLCMLLIMTTTASRSSHPMARSSHSGVDMALKMVSLSTFTRWLWTVGVMSM